MKLLRKFFQFFTIWFLTFSIILFQSIPCNAAGQDFVVISDKTKTLSVGDEFQLVCFTLSGKLPSFKSSKSSIVSVNSYGRITAKRPGSVKITAKVKGHEANCVITVRPTTISLSTNSVSLFRTNTFYLKAKTSTGHTPKFKSSRSSVASVDESGKIIAKKNGVANIKVSCDYTTVICEVTVKKPEITLSASTLTLKAGERTKLTAYVSSGNPVTWSVSNINILSVDSKGVVYARQKGKAYLYAYEDGTKVSCIIKVTES